MRINWTGVIGFTFIILFALGILAGVIISLDKELRTSYEMPNGIICERDSITGGSFGGATHEFYDCSDGKKYINPESYVEYVINKGDSFRDN